MRLNNKAADHMKKSSKFSSDERDELWSFLKEKVDIGLEARRPFEQKWVINLAFLSGKQYARFNASAHTLRYLKRPSGRVWTTDNQLLPRWRRQVADLIKTSPSMSVIPNTNDDEDVKAAKVGDKVIKSFWQSNQMRQKMRQLAGWMYATGNGFMDDRWNRKLGPIIKHPETGDLMYDGDVDCGIWSPFEVIVPALAMGEIDLHSFPWLVKMKRRSLDWVANNYERGEEVGSETLDSGLMEVGTLMGGATNALSDKIPSATVYDFYMQPCYAYPQGLFLTGANGIILQQDDYPLNYYHIEQFKDIDVPGVFWGQATMENAIGLQRTWNKTKSSIEEFNKNMGKGKWLIPRSCNVEMTPDDQHGERILYTPSMGFKPEHLTVKGLPSSYDQLLAVTRMSLEDLFSQHEVTRGTNKSDIRSGDMVSLLREQDAHGAIPAHSIFEESLERLMKRVLIRVGDEYTGERMLKIMGDEGEFEVFAFKGADLRGNTDVMIKRESSLPDSRMDRETRILNKYQIGLYGDPTREEVRREVSRMIGDARPDDTFAPSRLDQKLAERENQMLMKGEEVIPNEYDNHIIHMEVLNKMRKSIEYQRLKYEDQDSFLALDEIVRQHGDLHQRVIDEQRARMMAEQSRMGGNNA